MKIFEEISEITNLKNPIVTIGNFDGVHCGHLSIFNKMKELASKNNGETLVITFRKHPKNVLFPELTMKVLSDLEEKIEAIKNSGVDNLLIIDFTKEIAKMHAGEFIHEIIVNNIKASCIVMGYDNALGKNREGNIDYLQPFAKKYNFEVVCVEPYIYNEHPVSSTWIRNELLKGNVELSANLLGRNYSLSGKIVEGYGRGYKLGYPTANIDYKHIAKVIPEDGVYAVKVFLDDNRTFFGMANIGKNPTFKNDLRSVEVNIFDFDELIYDREMKVEFIHRVRGEIEFKSIDELIKKIAEDEKIIHEFLDNRNFSN